MVLIDFEGLTNRLKFCNKIRAFVWNNQICDITKRYFLSFSYRVYFIVNQYIK